MQLHELVKLAIDAGASDLMVTVGSPPLLRRYGVLMRCEGPRLTAQDTEQLLSQLLSEPQRLQLERCGEIGFSHSIFGTGRFRVNCFRQRGSAALAIRSIPSSIRPAAELGLPQAAVQMVLAESGFILVAGPPGSGRTTTIASLVDTINSHRVAHIITLEEPIEQLFRHGLAVINQREVGTDTATYATGLQAALQQTPDVIVLSRMPVEIAPLALQAAAGGLLVLTAVLAQSASEALAQLVGALPPHQQQPARIQLAQTLEGVICQRLLPRADGEGQVGAFEVLTMGQPARQAVLHGHWGQLQSLIEREEESGSVSMRRALNCLAEAGQITASTLTAATMRLELQF